jgi:hypothetical protein
VERLRRAAAVQPEQTAAEQPEQVAAGQPQLLHPEAAGRLPQPQPQRRGAAEQQVPNREPYCSDSS